MSGRPRTTSFAEGSKQPPNPPLGGLKISSKYLALPSFLSAIVISMAVTYIGSLNMAAGCHNSTKKSFRRFRLINYHVLAR